MSHSVSQVLMVFPSRFGEFGESQVDFLMESVDSKPCPRVKFCLGNNLSKKREISSAYFDMVVEIFHQNIRGIANLQLMGRVSLIYKTEI